MFENFDHLFTTRNYKITFLSAEVILSHCSDLLQVSQHLLQAILGDGVLGVFWEFGVHKNFKVCDCLIIPLFLKQGKCELHSNMKHIS